MWNRLLRLCKSQMWADINKELLISVKITEGMWSDGGCSSPSASKHQSCKVEYGIHKSQLCRHHRLFSTLEHLILGHPPGHSSTGSSMVHDTTKSQYPNWCAIWFILVYFLWELWGEFMSHVIPLAVYSSHTVTPLLLPKHTEIRRLNGSQW